MATLIKDIDDIRTIFPDLDADTSMASVEPYLEEGAELYMFQFISEAFYNELVTALGATSPEYTIPDLSASQQEVIYHLRRAQWYFGLYLALDSSITTFGSRGAREISEEGSSQPRQWVFNTSRESAINKADLFLDKALEVLETNPGNYGTWQGSDAFTIHHKYLITTVKDFTELGGSRRTFKRLQPFMKQVEDRYIEPSIGGSFLDELKTKIKAATALNTYEAKLLEFLRDAFRNYTLYLAAHELRMKLTDRGIMVASTDDGIGKYDVSDREDYHDWLAKKLHNGDYYMQRAKNYLEVNSSQFATYAGSDFFENKQPTSDVTEHINPDSNSVMI